MSTKDFDIKKIGIFLILTVAIILVIKKVVQSIKPPNANYIPGGGAVANNFNASNYADIMYDVISGIGTLAGTKNQAAQKLVGLTDNELVAVYNYWNTKYATEKSVPVFGSPFGTLPNAMKDEYNYPVIVYGSNYWNELLNRFNKLNLT